MWLLIYLTFANATISQYQVANKHRMNFGGIQIGVWEISITLAFLVAVLFGGRVTREHVRPHMNRLLVGLLGLWGLGFVCGVLGATMNAAPLKNALASGREYAFTPLCIFVGYRMISSLRAARTLVYTLIFAGVVVSTILLFYFNKNAELAGLRNSFNVLRTIEFVINYAGVACAILIYSFARPGVQMLPKSLAVLLAGYCLVGQFAPLGRTEWVAMMGCFAGLIVLMPPGKRMGTVFRLLATVPILLAMLWVGIMLASAAMQRDFMASVEKRIYSLLPTQRYSRDDKAWDSRIPGIVLELEIWSRNPLLGEGFAADVSETTRTGVFNYGANHNGWASILSKTGIFGFMAAQLTWIAMLVLGWKLTRESQDPRAIMMGAASFMAGMCLFVGVLATLIWTSRSGMFYGLVLGAAFKVYDLIHAEAPVCETDPYPAYDMIPSTDWR